MDLNFFIEHPEAGRDPWGSSRPTPFVSLFFFSLGNYFASHFFMGGEKFDTPHPEGYLFGENMDLNFLGNRPVQASSYILSVLHFCFRPIKPLHQVSQLEHSISFPKWNMEIFWGSQMGDCGKLPAPVQSLCSSRKCRWRTQLGRRDQMEILLDMQCCAGRRRPTKYHHHCRAVMKCWLLLLCSVSSSCTALQGKQKMQLSAQYPMCLRLQGLVVQS